MRTPRCALALLLLPALAAAAPPARPDAAPPPEAAIQAPAAAARPAPKPESQQQPQGSLIPPEAPLPAAAAPEPAPSAPQSPEAEATPAAPSGSLIPPATPAPAPPIIEGPPVPETLRESAFDLSACHLALTLLEVGYTTPPPITGEHRDCGIAQPVQVSEILPGIAIEGGAAMRCTTARSLALWMREAVLPAAARLPGAPRPVSLLPGSTTECRMTVGNSDGAKLSEHAVGNALDIAAFALDDGTRIEVATATGNDLPAAFLAAVRGAACLHFTTVLGPGSNAAHSDHLHLDVKARKGGYRLCE